MLLFRNNVVLKNKRVNIHIGGWHATQIQFEVIKFGKIKIGSDDVNNFIFRASQFNLTIKVPAVNLISVLDFLLTQKPEIIIYNVNSGVTELTMRVVHESLNGYSNDGVIDLSFYDDLLDDENFFLAENLLHTVPEILSRIFNLTGSEHVINYTRLFFMPYTSTINNLAVHGNALLKLVTNSTPKLWSKKEILKSFSFNFLCHIIFTKNNRCHIVPRYITSTINPVTILFRDSITKFEYEFVSNIKDGIKLESLHSAVANYGNYTFGNMQGEVIHQKIVAGLDTLSDTSYYFDRRMDHSMLAITESAFLEMANSLWSPPRSITNLCISLLWWEIKNSRKKVKISLPHQNLNFHQVVRLENDVTHYRPIQITYDDTNNSSEIILLEQPTSFEILSYTPS